MKNEIIARFLEFHAAINCKLILPGLKVLLILPWIATFINEVDYCADPAFSSPAREALPGTYDRWVGWSNMSDISCSGKNN